MAKHLIDLDEERLAEARAEFGTTTIKDTVNEALRRATSEREARIERAFEVLGSMPDFDRDDAWR